MLRESMQISGKQVDVRGVTQGFDEDIDIPHAAALVEFVEAVVARDVARIAAARSVLRSALGEAGVVDAAALVAALHGFVRIADAPRLSYTTAAGGEELPHPRAQGGGQAVFR